tara:strand:+ start:98 stop:892 length:795 start_codon:yes stop_codon:yes gene_type:complete
MAKLFNNIRKKLINDKPSTTRTANYLKYAIGEIILVVIGILIALQVNNWNETKKIKRKEKILTTKLIEAVREAKIETDRFFKAEESNIIALEKLLKNWKSISYKDTKNIFHSFQSKTFSPLFNLSSYSQFYNPNADVYNTAINDGSISIIKDEKFIQGLNYLYNYVVPRVNELMNEEYVLGQSINNHIALRYEKQFLEGTILDSTLVGPLLWSENTYQQVFQEMRNDGILKYKLAHRIELKKGRLVLTKLAYRTINSIISKNTK